LGLRISKAVFSVLLTLLSFSYFVKQAINHSRRCTANGADWIAGGYTNEKDASGNPIVIPHYVRFGRWWGIKYFF